MKAFLVQVTESSDIEPLFSVFTQQDSTLNQASNPTQVEKMVVTQKESPSCEQFDSVAALTIWEKQKQTRHIKLPSTNYSLQLKQGKRWLKPQQAIKLQLNIDEENVDKEVQILKMKMVNTLIIIYIVKALQIL